MNWLAPVAHLYDDSNTYCTFCTMDGELWRLTGLLREYSVCDVVSVSGGFLHGPRLRAFYGLSTQMTEPRYRRPSYGWMMRHRLGARPQSGVWTRLPWWATTTCPAAGVCTSPDVMVVDDGGDKGGSEGAGKGIQNTQRGCHGPKCRRRGADSNDAKRSDEALKRQRRRRVVHVWYHLTYDEVDISSEGAFELGGSRGV